jgi:short-subunit dehydrogenase
MTGVLIIGTSGGIGEAVAMAFLGNPLPNHLILHGRDPERLQSLAERVALQCEGQVTAFSGDIVHCAEDPSTLPEIEPVDAVVWCAGICELVPGQMLGMKTLRRTLAVNLEAPLVVLSQLYRKRVIKDGGVIVLVGSQAAQEAGEGFSVYAASKGGLASAARVLDKEFSRRGVRVHCIEPGTVDTPMTRRLMKQIPSYGESVAGEMRSAESVAEEVVAVVLDGLGLGGERG